MANCTVPKWFGVQAWFDARFSDLCDKHDSLYQIGCPFMKFYGDFWLAVQFARRRYYLISFFSLPYTLILGTPFWLLHRFDDIWRYLTTKK